MNAKQITVILSPLLIIGVMYPAFQFLGGRFGNEIGWYVGLWIYWVLWGGIFPIALLGKDAVLQLIKPQKLTLKMALLALFPVLMAVVFRLLTGLEYQKTAAWFLILLISTTLGNGFFEELLWRGVYLEVFPERAIFRMSWSTLWFALWHFAPGSVSASGNPLGLMIGAGMMGAYFAWLAHKTHSIWWTMIAHALGGLVMVL